MSPAARDYTSEIARRIGYLGTWLPNAPIHIGDIGTPDGQNVFVPMSSLIKLGINIDIESSVASNGGGDHGIGFTSKKGVEVAFKASGSTALALPHVPIDEAGIGFSFTRAHAVVFRADGLRHDRIADEIRLLADIRALVEADKWDPKWGIVTQVVHAESTTALVANSSGASAEFSVGAGVGSGGLELLRAEVGTKWAFEQDLAVDFFGQKGLTPLFRAKRLHKRWFRKETLRAAYSAELSRGDLTESDLDVTEEAEDNIWEDTPVYGGEDGRERIMLAPPEADPWGTI